MNVETRGTRMARCSCGNERPSADREILPFFEDHGEDSKWATEQCHCLGLKEIHQEINPSTGRAGVTDHEFHPRGPAEYDEFYCGCRGWD